MNRLKRYTLYVELNSYNRQITNERYTHYAEGCDARRMIKVANEIAGHCCLFDNFTGKMIWKK